MKSQKPILLLILVTTLATFSCKKKDKVETGTNFPEFLHAVWQIEGFGDGDETGIYFNSDSLGIWDYDGDDFDQGEDCYYAFYAAVIVSYKGDEYRIKYYDNSEETITIEVEDDLITIGSEEDGETTFSKDSRTVSGLTPLCSDTSEEKIHRIGNWKDLIK